MRTRVSVALTTLALSLLLPGMILAQQNTAGGGDKGNQGKQPQRSQREIERDLRQQRERERALRQRIPRPVRARGILADGNPLAGSTVSFTTLAAPKKARKAYEKATKELRKKKVRHSKVSKELEKAVSLYPKYALAWNLLGATRLKLKDEDGAREAFRRAIEADPEYVRPYIELAMLEGDNNRWEEVSRLSDRILELNPYVSQAHYFNAAANFGLGNLDLASKSISEYKIQEARGLQDVRR